MGKYEQMVLEWVKGGMNERIMNECIIYEWMNEWVSEWVNEWMNEWMNEWWIGTERNGTEGLGREGSGMDEWHE